MGEKAAAKNHDEHLRKQREALENFVIVVRNALRAQQSLFNSDGQLSKECMQHATICNRLHGIPMETFTAIATKIQNAEPYNLDDYVCAPEVSEL